MTHIITRPTAASTPISLDELLPWTLVAGFLVIVILYFLGAEQGTAAILQGDAVYDFVHDGRHLLGFPCP